MSACDPVGSEVHATRRVATGGGGGLLGLVGDDGLGGEEEAGLDMGMEEASDEEDDLMF